MRSRFVVVMAATLAVCGSAMAAFAPALKVPIPGLTGPSVEVPSAQRTATGGGVFVAKISSEPGSVSGQTVIGELQADGLLELAYGNGGLATLEASSSFIPEVLAIDPSTGSAWIGGQTGATSEIAAVNGQGELDRRFGNRGVLALSPTDSGGVFALSWRTGRLLVSAGTSQNCGGCELTVLNPATGATLVSNHVSSEILGGTGCSQATVTSAVFAGSQRELVGTRVPSNAECSATLTTLGPRLTPATSSRTSTQSPLPQPASWTSVASDDDGTCVAEADTSGISTHPLGTANGRLLTADRSDGLEALVPLGAGACAALLARPGRGPLVAQISEQSKTVKTAYLSAGLDGQTMFRCHQHLLVIATQGPASNRSTGILPIPIARGPFVLPARVSRPARATVGTGCT